MTFEQQRQEQLLAEMNGKLPEEELHNMRCHLQSLVLAEARQEAESWAREKGYLFQFYSLTTGRYEDVLKDIQRGKIAMDEAIQIVEKLSEFGAIHEGQRNAYLIKIGEVHG